MAKKIPKVPSKIKANPIKARCGITQAASLRRAGPMADKRLSEKQIQREKRRLYIYADAADALEECYPVPVDIDDDGVCVEVKIELEKLATAERHLFQLQRAVKRLLRALPDCQIFPKGDCNKKGAKPCGKVASFFGLDGYGSWMCSDCHRRWGGAEPGQNFTEQLEDVVKLL